MRIEDITQEQLDELIRENTEYKADIGVIRNLVQKTAEVMKIDLTKPVNQKELLGRAGQLLVMAQLPGKKEKVRKSFEHLAELGPIIRKYAKHA